MVRLLFHKVALSINSRFPLLLGRLQARRVSSRPQNGFLGVWYIGTVGMMRKDSPPPVEIASLMRRPVCGLALSCRRKTSFIFLFGRPLRIPSFHFFNVCTCRSKLWHLWPRIPLTRSLHYPRSRCRGWSISAGHVTFVLFSALKTMDPVSNCANICGTLTIPASEKSMNLYWAAAFCSKKFSHHSA